MLDSSILGNDNKEIDVALPEEGRQKEAAVQDDGQRSRREAIAQARAIRREAAAKERAEKRRAAEAAKAVLAGADPEASKKAAARRPSMPRAVRQSTGKFHWLEQANRRRTDTVAPEVLKKPPVELPQTDPDAIIAEIVAEVTAQAEQPLTSSPIRTSTAPVRVDAEELLAEQKPDADTDALVTQIVAEVQANAAAENPMPDAAAESDRAPENAKTEPAVKAAVGAAAETMGKPAAEVTPLTTLTTLTTPTTLTPKIPEVPEAPETPETPKTPEKTGSVSVPTAEEIAAEMVSPQSKITVEKSEDGSKVTITEKIVVAVPIAPQDDPLARALAAETAHQQEKKRAAEHAAEMEQAEADYKSATREAKRGVKKMARKAERAWKKEASAIEAKQYGQKSRRIAAGINIAACLLLLFGITAGMLLLERPTVSESELRALADLPDFSVAGYLSGAYTNGVAEYYNDTVPYRETFKQITHTFRQYFGLQGDAAIHGGAPVVNEAVTTPSEPSVTTAVTTTTTIDPEMLVTTTAVTTTTAAPPPAEPEEQGELSNYILIYQKRGIPLYGGSYSKGESYARSVNAYKERLGDGVHVYSMVIPTACSFYTPEQYQNLIGSEKNNIAHINENLVNVTPVDAYSALEKHTDEPIFMRTDHHWGAIGAFYASEEFSAAARVPFARLSTYEKIVKPGYVGTLYGYSGDIVLKNNPEDFIYYVPSAEYETTYFNTSLGNAHSGSLLLNLDSVSPVSWYLVYMGGDERVTHVHTAVNNGRTLAIIKDSYGNALVPWLTSSFEDIYVIDMRYFDANIIEYLKSVQTTDLLFAMNTFSATGGNSKKLAEMLGQ